MTGPDDRYDALLREAAQRLVDTLSPFGVLTRDRLAELSGASRWRAVAFDSALHWAVEHQYVRRLGTAQLYEVGRAAELDADSRPEEQEAGW